MLTGTNQSNTISKPSCFVTIVLTCCYLCTAWAFAQTPAPTETEPDYSHEAFVSEQDITRVTFENDGTSIRESTARIRIQSGAGVQRFGVLTFPYENSTQPSDFDYVRVPQPDGTTAPAPSGCVEDMSSEISRQAPSPRPLTATCFACKGLGVGDVLEFQTHWRT